MSRPKTKNLGKCAFDGCDYDAHALELCRTHWRQQYDGRELRPVKPYKKFAAPAPGLKICTRCERVLSVSEDFYKRTNGTPMSTCKKCHLKYMKDKLAEKQGKGRPYDPERDAE